MTGPVFLASLALIAITVWAPSATAQDRGPENDAVAVFNQGQDLHEKGDLAGALRLYKKAIEMNPEFPEAEYQRGVAALALGNDSEAESGFRRAIHLRADWSPALAKLGELLVRRYLEDPATDSARISGLAAEAATILESAVKADPMNFSALVSLADLRIHTASTAMIKETLAAVVALTNSKTNAPASLWRARSALEERLGLTADAPKSLARALSIEPDDKRALTQAVSLAIAIGDIMRARQLIPELEQKRVDTDIVLFVRARTDAADGDLRSARDLLAKINRPTGPMRRFRELIEDSLNTDAAELEKRLESDKGNVAILSRLCSLYRRDDPARSLAYCRRAAEAEPDKIEHAIGFGAALVQAKQYDAAVQLFTKLLDVQPDNATARANLATALFQLKRFEDAKTHYRKIAEAQPKVAATYYFLGIVHDQLDEYLDALTNYQLYLKLADPARHSEEIDRVKFRLPALQKLIEQGKGKKRV